MRPCDVLLPAIALVVLGCGGGGADSVGTGPSGGDNGGANIVSVGTNAYSPANITVPMAATVTWRWNSCTGSSDPYGNGETCVTHTVTFDDGSAESDRQSSGSY